MPLSLNDLETVNLQDGDFSVGIRAGRSPREEFKYPISLDATNAHISTVNYTVQPNDEHIYVDSSGQDTFITLPSLSTNQGRVLNVYADPGATTNFTQFNITGGDTVAGLPNFPTHGRMNFKLLATSSTWELVEGNDVQTGTRFVNERTVNRQKLFAWGFVVGNAGSELNINYSLPVTFFSIDHATVFPLIARSVASGVPTLLTDFNSDISALNSMIQVTSLSAVDISLLRTSGTFDALFYYGWQLFVEGRWR